MSDTHPVLMVSGGPFDGRSLTLEDQGATYTLGSGAECSLALELSNVEAVHARLVWKAGGVLLSDAGSSTGTYVNGEKIGDDHPLEDGDRVFLGPPGSKQSAKLLAKLPALVAIEGDEPAAEEDALPIAAPEPAPASDELILDDAVASDEPLIFTEDPVPPVQIEPAAPVAPRVAPAPPPVPAPAPTKPVEARAATKPQYTAEMPSFPTERARESVSVPAAASPAAPRVARPAPRPARREFSVPRAVILGGAAAVVAVGGFLAYRAATKPPPVLQSVNPPKVGMGATVTLGGTGFEPEASANAVRFGDVPGTVVSATETQIVVVVPQLPAKAAAADVPVVVEARGSRSNAVFLRATAAPRVASMEPEVAMTGDTVVLKGQNLAGEGLKVSVAQQPAEVLDAAAAQVRFRVPELPQGTPRSVPVVVQVGAEAGPPATLLIGRLPLLLEAAPTRGQAGERVTLRGRGFAADARSNAVTFGGAPALVLQATATELVVAAPSIGLESQATVPVAVQTPERSSTGDVSFTVARAGTGLYVPRFYPAPAVEHADHDHAFVSTELGPLLLLTGKADAASTAQRAERTAAALNALVEAALAGKPARLEVRSNPAAAVAAVGASGVVVTATAADAAAYDEGWDAPARGRRSNPGALAAFWTALLEDHLLLFVERKRPFRTLELSSRGKVLAEIYGEAARRTGPGLGVPVSVLSPWTPSRARMIREMALTLPTEGASRAAGAVEGRWTGNIEEGGQASRAVDIRLVVEASGRLVGSASIRAGRLSMDQPLRDATYDRQTLRFVLVLGGDPKHFVGTVDGETITGTIHTSANAATAIGQFTLRFVE